MKRTFAALAALACLLFASVSFADQPKPWQMGMQEAATSIMAWNRSFEQYTLRFIVPITIFVLILLIIVVVKFRAAANPVPSKTSHHVWLEIGWTVIPVLLLFAIAIPSFQLLTYQLKIPENPDITIKATATQWLWSYEYQGEQTVSFDSYMLKEADRPAAGKEDVARYPRLLAVDNEVVVPVGKIVRLLVTAAPTDVIHAFAMPAFGIKIDAIPGRLNETWFNADREGLYYGQCSELCGKDHAFMPIAIRVVSEAQYATWLQAATSDLSGANRALMAAVDGAPAAVQTAENTTN